MVYGIVTGIGGTIQVESRPGAGSTFTIQLPRRCRSSAVTEQQDSEARARGGVETVLLVEDDDMLRGLVEISLTGRGYRVLAAGTPQEAIEIAGAASPLDLLISDVVMPGGTGYRLVQTLTATHPALKVILMSGDADDVLARGERASTTTGGFLHKPFGMQELLRMVRRVLDEPPAHRRTEQSEASLRALEEGQTEPTGRRR